MPDKKLLLAVTALLSVSCGKLGSDLTCCIFVERKVDLLLVIVRFADEASLFSETFF